MATALAYPESKRGRGNIDSAKSVLNTDISSAYLKHARFVLRHCRDKAESGMDLKQYAHGLGKAETTMRNKLMAYRVGVKSHVGFSSLRDSWRNLAEIHAAPDWLWTGLVKAMIEGNWTVATTRLLFGIWALRPYLESPFCLAPLSGQGGRGVEECEVSVDGRL